MRESKRREAGSVMIFTAILLPVLCGLAGLALDVSYLYGQRQATQQAADAAAEAGAIAMAQQYSTSTVKSDASHYAAVNGYSSSNSTVQVNVPPVSPPASGSYSSQYVQVVITVHTQNWLSRILGVVGLSSTVQAVASSTAVLTNNGLLWVLDHGSNGALSSNGNGCLMVNGQTWVNSGSANAITNSGPGCGDGHAFDISQISVVGGWNSGCCSPTPASMSQAVADPLARITMPSYSNGFWQLPDGTALSTQTLSTNTLSPGVYVGGITISGNGNYTLNPGIYIMDGGGFSISGGATVNASGVFIYNGSSTGTCGAISLSGNGTHILSSPTSGTYQGVVLAQDRTCNTGDTIVGGSGLSISGAIYLPKASLSLQGNSGISNDLMARIIVNTLSVGGTPGISLSKPDASHSPLVGSSLVE